MSIWQTKPWSEMLKRTGQVHSNIKLGNIYIQKRSIGLGQYGLFIMGILPDTFIDHSALINICKKEGASFLQIEVLDYSGEKLNTKIEQFSSGSFKKFITPHTALINLNQSHDEILAAMKPKGRYNIRLAEKKGVISEIVKKTDKNIQSFFQLSQETTARDKFAGHSFDYYKKFLELLPSSQLILAKTEGKVIAGGIFIFNSDVSIYYYGASSSEKQYRNLMAPYAVQWTAIQHAKKMDSQLYDFLGVSGTGIYEDESLRGVTDFKMKLTPDNRRVSHSFIYKSKKISFLGIIIIRKLKSYFK